MITLRQTATIKQTLKLRQVLSPKIIQTLRTFGLSYSDIVERIQNESEDNVAIEVVQFDRLSAIGSKHLTSIDDVNTLDTTRSKADSDYLHTHLIHQLEMVGLPRIDHDIALDIISEIDDRGYIERFSECQARLAAKYDVDPRKITTILKHIHTYEPDGVGARTLKECLMLQIDSHHFDDERLKRVFKDVISNHLEALSRGDFDTIADQLNIEPDGVQAIAEFIKSNLDPFPGHKFKSTQDVKLVIPSFSVDITEDSIRLTNLEHSQGIQIAVSEHYKKMLASPTIDAESKHYLEEKIQKATELVETLEKRRQSLEQLVQVIVITQSEFIKRGVQYLVPLQQQQLAETVAISPSTVSRLVASKYIETPHGTFSLRQLCPRSHFGHTADRLKQIIGAVCHEFPTLSDLKIAAILNERGLPIARRTVAKYRLLHGVDSSYDRPTH